MKVLIGGTPLESLGWQRDLCKVRIIFRDGTSGHDKAEFIRDLLRALIPLQMQAIKESVADGSYVAKTIDWEAIAKLPPPSMSSDELMRLMREDAPTGEFDAIDAQEGGDGKVYV